MANIDSVLLPNGSAYNLVDDTSGYQTETLATPIDINGTQETTVEGALGGLNDYVDDTVEAAFDVYGSKNLFNIHGLKKIDSCIVANNGFVNDNTDTLSYYKCKIVAYDSNDTEISTLFSESISQTGLQKINLTIPSNTAWIRFEHNGDYRLIYIDFVPNNALLGLSAIMTFNVNGCDPSTNGGLDVRNIMIQDARIIDDTFVPYAETNLQLTKKTSGLSNENLLINPFFTINERGQSSYTSVSLPIDAMNGWELTDTEASGTTMTKGSSGWSFSGDYARLRQIVSTPYCDEGSTVTISLKVNGTVYSITDTIESNVKYQDISALGIRVYYRTTVFSFTETSAHLTNLQAVKLELGTISTLANDAEPNKNVEIIKCQNPLRVVGTPNIYRGKKITLNADFWARIADGTFENQQVGDTITINGRPYILAHANYWLHTGNITECVTNHWVVVSPNMGNAKMNNDNSTIGGYLGSGFRSGRNHDNSSNTALADAIATIKSDFGASHILSHKECLDNAVSGGYPSADAWVDSEAELMSQIMAYGNRCFDPSTNLGATIPSINSVDKSQLALYAQRPDLLVDRSTWWLRDVVSSGNFAIITNGGAASYYGAANAFVIRLVFGIKA